MKSVRYYMNKILRFYRHYRMIRLCDCSRTSVFYDTSNISSCMNWGDIKIGDHSHIKGELLTFGHGGEIIIGNDCFLGESSRVWSAKKILIGNRVLISHNVNIFDNITHPISAKERHGQFKEIISRGQPKNIDLQEKSVEIQDDVLIGCMSVILRGVTIGRGAIIGAGSVVTHNVPAWTIAAGNPAKVIRVIPEEER